MASEDRRRRQFRQRIARLHCKRPWGNRLEAFGSTRLDQVANEFFLHDGAGNGPSLKYGGADVVAGQFGAWTPIGAEKAGGGYQVAWKNGTADQYIVWNTDSNGNYASNATGVVSGADYALQSLETTFQQDLNGDGTTGLKTTPIETSGATRLDQVANEFFLHDSGGIGPSLKYQGTSSPPASSGPGRRSAWRRSAAATRWPGRTARADQYIVWNTDSNGNYTGNATGVVSGADYALQVAGDDVPAGPQRRRHDGTEDDADRDVGRDASGPGGQRVLPARQRRQVRR